MKFSCFFNLVGIDDAGLSDKTDFDDWAILEYIASWQLHSAGAKQDGLVWLNYKHLLEEIPMLGLRTTASVSRRIKKLRDLGLLSTKLTTNNTMFAGVTDFYLSIVAFRQEPAETLRQKEQEGGQVIAQEQDVAGPKQQNSMSEQGAITPAQQGTAPEQVAITPVQEAITPAKQAITPAQQHQINNNKINNNKIINNTPPTPPEEIFEEDEVGRSEVDLSTSASSKIPYAEIQRLFNETLPNLPKVLKLTDARKRGIKNLWQSDLPDLESWRFFFGMVQASDFLCGRKTSSDFQCCFDWVLKPGNALKIAEGNYKNKIGAEDDDDDLGDWDDHEYCGYSAHESGGRSFPH